MSEKKVIEQDDRYAVQVEHTDDSVILMQGNDLYANGIGINKPKATEVAKAIDPEYQKVIDERDGLKEQHHNDIILAKQSVKQIELIEQRNAKLVEALESQRMSLVIMREMIDNPVILSTISIRLSEIDQALQNTKNIEG